MRDASTNKHVQTRRWLIEPFEERLKLSFQNISGRGCKVNFRSIHPPGNNLHWLAASQLSYPDTGERPGAFGKKQGLPAAKRFKRERLRVFMGGFQQQLNQGLRLRRGTANHTCPSHSEMSCNRGAHRADIQNLTLNLAGTDRILDERIHFNI